MFKHPTLTEERISAALPRLRALLYPEKAPLRVEAWHVHGEPVPVETALNAAYHPFQVGETWGPLWDTTWFRFHGVVPATWKGREVVALVRVRDGGREGFTAEGLIYRGTTPVRALNAFRSEVDVCRCAEGGEAVAFHVEAAANFSDPEHLETDPGPGPLFTFAQADLACVDREAFALYYDFELALQAMQSLPEASQRRAELRTALNGVLNIPGFGTKEGITPARNLLAPLLAKRNGDTVHRLSGIGHAHIDTAWLWPLRETIRKCARTFSTAVDYMDRYPEYVFGCSQAQQYAWMKAYYPEIYSRMKACAARGQWEVMGSMWVEVDCNLASGESLIRQLTHGKRFFREEFGVDTRNAWIPDVFGYSAALPQIYRKAGIDSFITQKISWNQTNKFPHHTFLWEGIDGSRIFTHFPPADTYNGEMDVKTLLFNVSNFREHGRASRSLYVYGFGDGGGGPTVEMLERARRLKDFDGLPQLELEPVARFLEKAKEDATDLPVWVGELYLELHRGTYTTQGKTKRGNRKGEFLLRDAELLDVVSHLYAPERKENAVDPKRAVYDVTGLNAGNPNLHKNALDRAWKLLLLNQFHDIIPGSSINWVYRDAEQDYGTIAELGQSVIDSSLENLSPLIDTTGFSKPMMVLNTLNIPRKETIDLYGKPIRVQVPACGYTVIDASVQDQEEAQQTVRVQNVSEGGLIIENELLRIHLNHEGVIVRLTDLEMRREVLAEGEVANLFQLHEDRPNKWDAWDIDIFYKESHTDLRGPARLEVIEQGSHRATVLVERTFGQSKIRQEVRVTAGSRRIDFVTHVEWQEEHRLLKVAFPVAIRSPKATYEIQFGHVERPTHYNTSWDLARFEVCAHKWADLSEAGYGVALLNDCKYGYDIFDHTLRLSLLRSPKAPDPTADRGEHHFTYSLLPHPGDFREGRVIEEAYALNVPLLTTPLSIQSGPLPSEASWFTTDREGVIIESIKAADDGDGVVVRLYEAYGSRGPVTLCSSLPFSRATLTNLLEEPERSLPFHDQALQLEVNPFEIITIRLQ